MTELASLERFKTFWPRFWAGIVDGIVFMPLSLIDTWIWSNVSTPSLLAPWFVIYSFSFLAYSIILHGIYGQTIGKRFTGVKVLDVAESRLSMRQAVLRDSVYAALAFFSFVVGIPEVLTGINPNSPQVSSISDLGLAATISIYASMAWFIVELVTMLSNSKRRALHDFIAGSVVVRVNPSNIEHSSEDAAA